MSVKWELIGLVVVLATGPAMAASQPALDIPTECSARIFDAASAKFITPGASYARLRIMPTYGEHIQVILAEDPSGDLRVQHLAVGPGRNEDRDAKGECPSLALKEKRHSRRISKLRRLFEELRTLQVPLKFPSILYLDDTTYELMADNQRNSTLLLWTGLDEPEALKICSLCRWAQKMKRVFR